MTIRVRNVTLRVLLLSTLSLTLSCENEKSLNNNDSKFGWSSDSEPTERWKNFKDSATEINLNGYYSETIQLSSIIDTFSFLKLDDSDNNFIGEIDKIVFNENYIFVMDKYISESVQAFDKVTGEKIFVLNNHGDGPGEFKSLYDFVVNFESQEILIFDGRRAKFLILKVDLRKKSVCHLESLMFGKYPQNIMST
jgi:hypothetical protein